MRTRHLLFAAAAGILAAAPLTAAASQAIEIRAGETAEGRFTSTDPTLPDGSHYRIYRYQGTPGERIAVTLRSPDFDAFLAGGTMEGEEFGGLDYDDDGAGGTDALLEAEVGPGGVYHIRANTLLGGETGAYTLRVETLAPGAAPGTRHAPLSDLREISRGETVHGRLTSSDPTLADDTHYHLYRYRGTPGEEIVVTLRSPDFDAFLAGGVMVGDRPRMVEMDDDGAGGTDARIRARVGSDGEYYIRANTLMAGETGEYTLVVEPSGPGGRL